MTWKWLPLIKKVFFRFLLKYLIKFLYYILFYFLDGFTVGLVTPNKQFHVHTFKKDLTERCNGEILADSVKHGSSYDAGGAHVISILGNVGYYVILFIILYEITRPKIFI